jgi:anaphase-promoting complex subunit 8
MRDYDQAQSTFEAVRDVDPYRIEYLDTYSNILYVKERKAELSYLAHTLSKVDKFASESCVVIGNYYSLKGKHEKSIVYFQRALRQNSMFLEARTLMGHEFMELGNVELE